MSTAAAQGKQHRDSRGASLLEAVFAVALSGLMLSSTATTITAATDQVRRQRSTNDALDLVRRQLEHAIAHPCAAPAPCDPPFGCRVEREVALVPNLGRPYWVIRLRAAVALQAFSELPQDVTVVTTLVARSGPCAR